MSMFISNDYLTDSSVFCGNRDAQNWQRAETPEEIQPATSKRAPQHLVSIRISGSALEPVRIRIRRS
jgi:hypothetical protein